MSNLATIKINTQTGEIELSGSEEFVKSHIYLLEPHLKALPPKGVVELKEKPRSVAETNAKVGGVKQVRSTASTNVKKPAIAKSFNSYIKKLPKSTRPGDYLLAAAHFVSSSSSDGYFGTRETSALLKDAGIDILNPSQYVKNSLNAGRIEALDKRRFNILEKGFAHLNKVFNK